ncbi:hypothetical protein [Salmon gill poxvirus]|nr:hypothetical protein [Salmon gill poxvirus]
MMSFHVSNRSCRKKILELSGRLGDLLLDMSEVFRKHFYNSDAYWTWKCNREVNDQAIILTSGSPFNVEYAVKKNNQVRSGKFTIRIKNSQVILTRHLYAKGSNRIESSVVCDIHTLISNGLPPGYKWGNEGREHRVRYYGDLRKKFLDIGSWFKNIDHTCLNFNSKLVGTDNYLFSFKNADGYHNVFVQYFSEAFRFTTKRFDKDTNKWTDLTIVPNVIHDNVLFETTKEGKIHVVRLIYDRNWGIDYM